LPTYAIKSRVGNMKTRVGKLKKFFGASRRIFSKNLCPPWPETVPAPLRTPSSSLYQLNPITALGSACCDGWLEFNVPFQHEYGNMRDDVVTVNVPAPFSSCRKKFVKISFRCKVSVPVLNMYQHLFVFGG